MKLKAVSGIMVTLLLTGMLTLAFNIQPVKASGTIYIRADGSVVPSTANITSVDNITYTFIGNINEPIVIERDNIVVDGLGYTLQGPGNGTGIMLNGRSNVIIKNTQIKSFFWGIGLYWSLNSTISRNNITANNDAAIYLRDSSNITVSGNSITSNLIGICFSGSSNNTITGNNIKANNGEGIFLYGHSNYSTISGNNITDNWCGISCFAACMHNTISGNTITNNDYGIYPGSNNTIYHNNIIGNIQQVKMSVYANFWDDGYPSGGNYWSDYVDKDEFSGPSQDQPGSDGIGDEPYIIDGSNSDRYPLMTPPILYEHDLVASLWAPDSLIIGTSTTLKATVYNLGLNNENNVELKLLINDIVVDSEVISELASGSFSTFNYSWTPTVEGIRNVTASVIPVSSELTTINNVMSIMVNVYTPPTGPTELYLSPSESHAFVGSIITIDVMVAEVEDLFAWEVRLYFDPVTLNFKEAWLPPDHVFAGKTIIPVSAVMGSDENGTYIDYGCTLVFPGDEFTGNGRLCKMNFTGIAEGSYDLTFGPMPVTTFLLNSTGADITFEVADGLVVVEEVEGDLSQDGVVDMRDISLAAAAFGSYPDHPRWNPTADINEDNEVNMRDIVAVAKNFGKTA